MSILFQGTKTRVAKRASTSRSVFSAPPNAVSLVTTSGDNLPAPETLSPFLHLIFPTPCCKFIRAYDRFSQKGVVFWKFISLSLRGEKGARR